MIRHFFQSSISSLKRLIVQPQILWRELTSRGAYQALASLPGIGSGRKLSSLCRRLLVDGNFLNPGYFYRMQLFRAAVDSKSGDELGWVWRHNSGQCVRILKTLGINNTQIYHLKPDPRWRKQAREIRQSLRFAEDVLRIEFPYKIPAAFFYDYLLKCQRAASVNVNDPLLEWHIWDFISSIYAAEKILEKYQPDMVAMSHSISLQCTPLSWLAAQQGVPVITLYGYCGLPRFWRMNQPQDIFYGMDRPRCEDIKALATDHTEALAFAGRQYLSARFSGKTDDLGGRLAFAGRGDRNGLNISKSAKPIVAVYASNWFDFPHSFGMCRFRDFLDWIQATLEVAIATTSVHWLFRAHPCDQWYGGLTLKDLMPKILPEHITLVPTGCQGSRVMEVADALVTFHGTAAIEYASQGKPVLVADQGWYHDCGFVVFPDSREHYLQLLGQDWFNRVDRKIAQRQAEIFAGFYFCCPDWQAASLLPDDSDRRLLEKRLLTYPKDYEGIIRRETAQIRSWLASKEPGYHTFKMKHFSGYALSNIADRRARE